MPKTNFRIDLLGTSILIATDEDPIYLNTLLNIYRQKVENAQKITGLADDDSLKLSLVTGFLLCDELERLRNGGAASSDALQAEQITIDLIQKIEKAIPVDFEKTH